MKKRAKTKGWDKERRRKYARMIRAAKPWLHATGPQTQQGKNKAKMNALKHGTYSGDWLELQKALAAHRRFIAKINKGLREKTRRRPAYNPRQISGHSPENGGYCAG